MNRHYRDRDLLDSVYQIECQLQLPCCVGGAGEPAHSNQSRHGKGGSIKAHDVFIAAGCRACHRELDQGRSMNREEKFDAWQRGHERTLLELFRQGIVGVINQGRAA